MEDVDVELLLFTINAHKTILAWRLLMISQKSILFWRHSVETKVHGLGILSSVVVDVVDDKARRLIRFLNLFVSIIVLFFFIFVRFLDETYHWTNG